MGGINSTMASTPPQFAATNGTGSNQTTTMHWRPSFGGNFPCIVACAGYAYPLVSFLAVAIYGLWACNWRRLHPANIFGWFKAIDFHQHFKSGRRWKTMFRFFFIHGVKMGTCLAVLTIGKATGLMKLFALIMLCSAQYCLCQSLRKQEIGLEVLTVMIMSGVIVPMSPLTEDWKPAFILVLIADIVEFLLVQYFACRVRTAGSIPPRNGVFCDRIAIAWKGSGIGVKAPIFVCRCLIDEAVTFALLFGWLNFERPELWPDENICIFVAIASIIAFVMFVSLTKPNAPSFGIVAFTMGLLCIETSIEPLGKAFPEVEMLEKVISLLEDSPRIIVVVLHATAITLCSSWKCLSLNPPALSSPEHSRTLEEYELGGTTQHSAGSDIAQIEV